MNLYTLGYQGIDLSTYVKTLKRAGVGVVVDVRETPWSYKKGFSKTALSEELSRAGIEYVHVRSAGNPKENRRTARDQQECLQRYRKHLENTPEAITDLLQVLDSAAKKSKSACLTCFEKEPHDCHRSILASALNRRSREMRPVHLQA